MAKDKPKIGTLEILVAVFTVVFIFSVVGLINFDAVIVPVAESIDDSALDESAVVTSVDVVGPGSVVHDVGGNMALQSGTALSPAWSSFEVMP